MLAWHVEKMEDFRIAARVLREKPEKRGKAGRPRKRWLEDVEEDLKAAGWRKKAKGRKELGHC